MAVAHVYRMTFKERNCTVTIKKDKSHTTKERKNNEVSFSLKLETKRQNDEW